MGIVISFVTYSFDPWLFIPQTYLKTTTYTNTRLLTVCSQHWFPYCEQEALEYLAYSANQVYPKAVEAADRLSPE